MKQRPFVFPTLTKIKPLSELQQERLEMYQIIFDNPNANSNQRAELRFDHALGKAKDKVKRAIWL